MTKARKFITVHCWIPKTVKKYAKDVEGVGKLYLKKDIDLETFGKILAIIGENDNQSN